MKIRVLTAPLEILAWEGLVTGVSCQAMTLGEFDRSGRRRPVVGADAPFVILADQVITAIGQRLDPSRILGDLKVELNRDGFIAADSYTGQTSLGWLYSGGDAVTGPSSVVEAVAGGERAAVAMDAQLTGFEHAFWQKEKACTVPFDPDAAPVRYARAHMELLPVERRRENFSEVEQSWTEQVAVCEAKRCLRCDYRESGD